MYTPAQFRFDDQDEMVAFMKQYGFATVVSISDQFPVATHIPMVVEQCADVLKLSSHMAVANPQAKGMDGSNVLVIFSEPHAYISPTHYTRWESVPTWNYLAVHACGNVRVLHEEDEKMRGVEAMIRYYEPSYLDRWQSFSARYKRGMLAGILAFEVEVSTLEGVKKLSQNKSSEERGRIADHLIKTGGTPEETIAGYLRQNL